MLVIFMTFDHSQNLGGHLWQSEGGDPSFALEVPFEPGQGFHLSAVPDRGLQRFTVEAELFQARHSELLVVVVL